MHRLTPVCALVLALSFPAGPAAADVMWYTSQLRQQECFSASSETALEQALRSCTYVVRTQRGAAHVEALGARGDLYFRLGEYERALADYSRVIRFRPQSATTLYSRGEANLALGRYGEALADAEQVVALRPRSASGHRLLCEVRVLRGQDLEAARRDCEQAIAADPGDGRAYAVRGLLNLRGGADQQAWLDFNTAISNGWGDARTRYGRGVAAQRLGQGDASSDFAEAERLQGDIGEAFAALGLR